MRLEINSYSKALKFNLKIDGTGIDYRVLKEIFSCHESSSAVHQFTVLVSPVEDVGQWNFCT